MITTPQFIADIRKLIEQGNLAAAIKHLALLLKNSPRLDEAIQQSARYNNVMQAIRLGTIDYATANITQNQIQYGVLQLLTEMEEQAQNEPPIKVEMEHFATKMQNSATITGNNNITIQGVSDSTISIHTGNTTNQTAEKIYHIEHIDTANFS